MRLKYQLFLILLLVSALLITLMAGFGRWSFDRGFVDYVNQVERQRLEPLVDALADGHAEHGSWAWIAEAEPQVWWSLMRESGLAKGRRRHGRGSRPPPDAGLLLAGADRGILIGRTPPDRSVRWQPIENDERTIGYLGYRAVRSPPRGIDQAFAAQQRRGFVYAALGMVLLSAIVALVLAARIVRPLHGVAAAVERIGRGDYAKRLPVGRRDELGDLGRDVNRLAATLETSLATRRRWLAEISHELRTPVAILRGELEAIQDGVRPLDRDAVTSLHAESLRLNRLIDDLHTLTLSDAGALDYRFEALDLHALVRERLEAGQSAAVEHDLTVELAATASRLFVRGDRQRLEQLVDNLLQNSLRYTDAGGAVQVSLAREADRVVVDWADSAPGVAAVDLPHLFEPLYRVEASRARSDGGAGLGLAIVTRIVDAHEGSVVAQPSKLGGLAIRIDLPASERNAR